jgi:hypothetical protein
LPPPDSQLVIVFGSVAALLDAHALAELRVACPRALLFGCSTAGEIIDTCVHDDSLAATSIRFEHVRVRLAVGELMQSSDSHRAGRDLAVKLAGPELRHVFVLSDGLHVNGTRLAAGLRQGLPESVAVTGGLSADGDRFIRTLVLAGDRLSPNLVAALGFYGKLDVGYGALGGWDPFGPERVITRSVDNVLYELDGRSALELYKEYLGPYAEELPGAALRFPLSVRAPGETTRRVRTVLSVDNQTGSLTFAGDVPDKHLARLMKANFDRLIEGASEAARLSRGPETPEPELSLLVSCVGRRLVLGQRVEEELESVREVSGARAKMTGFYSYGELCPVYPHASCELHNQTMTVTTLREA